MRKHDESKLPQWAQDRLGYLRRDLILANHKLDTGGESMTAFKRGTDHHSLVALDTDRVVFDVHGDVSRTIEVFVTAWGTLEVYSNRPLKVSPRSSNVVWVEAVDR